MLHRRLGVLTAAVGLALGAAGLRAHHSFAAEFDAEQPVTLTGTVAKIEFVNPHAWLYLDVTDEDGHVTRWNVEMGSPNRLIRRGFSKNSVPVGTTVVVEGFRAKDGSPTVNSRTVTLPDGQGLYTGSPGTGAPE